MGDRRLLVEVDDVDAHHARAVAAGATVIRPLEDTEEAGMRLYTAEDPEGHRWMFGQRRRPHAARRLGPRRSESMRTADLLDLPGLTPYAEAFALQRALAARSRRAAMPGHGDPARARAGRHARAADGRGRRAPPSRRRRGRGRRDEPRRQVDVPRARTARLLPDPRPQPPRPRPQAATCATSSRRSSGRSPRSASTATTYRRADRRLDAARAGSGRARSRRSASTPRAG